MKIFKCEADDTVYIIADTIDTARARLIEVMGEQILDELLTWTEVAEIPDGEIAL